jgi:L-arabinose isomerase
VWEPQPDLATSAECWLAAGGPHHTVLSAAVGTEELYDFATIIGTELLIIDEATTPRRFQQEIHWNDAYYKLGYRR